MQHRAPALSRCDSPVQQSCAAISLCLRPPSYRRTGHRPWVEPSAPTHGRQEIHGWNTRSQRETGNDGPQTVCLYLGLTPLPQQPFVLLCWWTGLTSGSLSRREHLAWKDPALRNQRVLEQGGGLEVGAVILLAGLLLIRSHPAREGGGEHLQRSAAGGGGGGGGFAGMKPGFQDGLNLRREEILSLLTQAAD